MQKRHENKSPRGIPLRLAEKFKQIRTSLGLSQKGISIGLGNKDTRIHITRSGISNYELGKRKPSLLIIFTYAKLANVSVELLIDDAVDLPDTIPGNENWIKNTERARLRTKLK